MSIPVLIYPVLNRFDLLNKSLSCIDYPINEILIINNSGDDSQTVGLEGSHPNLNIRILNLPSNMGVAGSWNLGIKLYPWVNYWMFGSADTTMPPGSWEQFHLASGSDRFVSTKVAGWSMFSLGENIIEKTGLLDEYLYPAYFEDNDYGTRFQQQGFTVENGNIIHLDIEADQNGVSQTIKSNPEYFAKNQYTYLQNSEYYLNKVATGDWTSRGWDLKRRRDHEWLQKP